MVNWKRLLRRGRGRASEAADSSPAANEGAALHPDTVLAVDREVGVYARAVLGKLSLATVLAATAVIALAVIDATSETDVVWARFDADKTLAAFGVVGLIVTALQVATRSARRADVDPTDGARQQFLGTVAFATMPVVLWFGFYVSWVSASESGASELDAVGVYGPLFIALALAVIAADAAAARPFDPSDPVAVKARQERHAAEARRALRTLTRRTRTPPNRWRAVDILIAVAAIAAQVGGISWLLGIAEPLLWLLLVGLLAAVFVGTCQVVVEGTLATARGRSATAGLLTAPAVAAWLFLGLTVLGTALATSTEQNWQQRTAAALLIFVGVTGSDVVIATGLMGVSGRRRRLLRELAIRSECKRLNVLRKTAPRRDTVSPQALASLYLSPLFPLGLLLAQPVFSELRVHPHPPTRSIVRWTVVVSTVSGVILAGVLVATALGWNPLTS